MRSHLIGIGHSHLACLREAYVEQCRQQGHPKTYSIDFQHIAHFRNELGETARPPMDALPEHVDAAILRATRNAGSASPAVLLSLMGADYFFFGIAVHPRKYDFVLPERPDLEVADDAEILSPALVESAVRLEADISMDFIAFLQSKAPFPCYFYACPPPIKDSAFLSGVGHIRDRLAQTGITSPSFRLKLWLLQERLYRAGCEALGVTYIEAPPETKDEQGFLLPEYWNEDGFHGNARYGQVMLRHVVGSIIHSENPT